MDNVCLVRTAHSKLMMAEALAYNQNCLSYVGDLFGPKYWSEETERYVRFFLDHFQYYKGTENIAPVAVLRTYPTMAYSSYNTQYSTYLFEQTLIQTRIPFDIIFDRHLEEELSKYKVLVLANQECMTDDQIGKVKSFVKNGGGLVVTGSTSLYNEWRRMRLRMGLRDMFDRDLPLPSEVIKATDNSTTGISGDFRLYSHSSLVRKLEGYSEAESSQVRNEYGKGRIVYIPEIKPGISKPASAANTSEYWVLPENFTELEEAVKWAAGEDTLSVEVQAPKYVTMEWLMQKNHNRMLIHLVNYNVRNQPEVKNIAVRLKIPEGKRVKHVTVLTPDTEVKSGSLPSHMDKGWLNFSVPGLNAYDLITVQFE